jgi:hypothetical protein
MAQSQVPVIQSAGAAAQLQLLYAADSQRPVRTGLGKLLDPAWFSSRRPAGAAAVALYSIEPLER